MVSRGKKRHNWLSSKCSSSSIPRIYEREREKGEELFSIHLLYFHRSPRYSESLMLLWFIYLLDFSSLGNSSFSLTFWFLNFWKYTSRFDFVFWIFINILSGPLIYMNNILLNIGYEGWFFVFSCLLLDLLLIAIAQPAKLLFVRCVSRVYRTV